MIDWILKLFLSDVDLTKDYSNSLKVEITEFGVKLDLDSLLSNDVVTEQVRGFKTN